MEPIDYHLKEIVLDERFAKYSVNPTAAKKVLPSLSKINIFVGSNNSGKSRFLRSLASLEKINFIPHVPSEIDFLGLEKGRIAFMHELSKTLENFGLSDLNKIQQTFSKIRTLESLTENEGLVSQFITALETVERMRSLESYDLKAGAVDRGYYENVLGFVKNLAVQYKTRFLPTAQHFAEEYKFRKLYLPTLRGLRRFRDAGDCYQKKTLDEYFPNTAEFRPEVFTGLGLYDEIQKLLLGDLKEREIVADFQKFLGKAFFENQEIALLPKMKGDTLEVKIGDEAEMPIHSLGDGIQTIITLTFPLFKYRNQKLLVFFEEPEIYLHPGLQRVLLNVLTKFEGFQYFLTTHSNHFLDLTLDATNVSIFTFKKELESSASREKTATFNVENVSNENTHSLELLGVRNASVFLSNCTIWVEGITDRRYLCYFLKLHMADLEKEALLNPLVLFRRFREDLHFSFVEYSGGNITHWSFLDSAPDNIVVDRLCGKLFLITDSDNATSGAKADRHKTLKEKLGDRYYCLECTEIENLLTPDVIKAVIAKYEGEQPVFRKFGQASYKSRKLGHFIESKVFAAPQKRRGSYADASGTVAGKVDFCQKALDEMKSFSELSEEAQSLTKKVYDFIKQHNS